MLSNPENPELGLSWFLTTKSPLFKFFLLSSLLFFYVRVSIFFNNKNLTLENNKPIALFNSYSKHKISLCQGSTAIRLVFPQLRPNSEIYIWMAKWWIFLNFMISPFKSKFSLLRLTGETAVHCFTISIVSPIELQWNSENSSRFWWTEAPEKTRLQWVRTRWTDAHLSIYFCIQRNWMPIFPSSVWSSDCWYRFHCVSPIWMRVVWDCWRRLAED